MAAVSNFRVTPRGNSPLLRCRRAEGPPYWGVPHALLAHRATAEGRESTARQKRSLQNFPEHLARELDEAEEILKINAQLVENYKATAKAAVKRKTLVQEEAALLGAERSVASKRQRLEQKRQKVDLVIRVSLTRAEHVKIPAPQPSYVTGLWREGREGRSTAKASAPAPGPELVRDGKILRPVLQRYDSPLVVTVAESDPETAAETAAEIVTVTVTETAAETTVTCRDYRRFRPPTRKGPHKGADVQIGRFERDRHRRRRRVRNSLTPKKTKKERKNFFFYSKFLCFLKIGFPVRQ